MRRNRVHLPVPLNTGETVSLPDEAAHHLATVLRLTDGDALVVFNGQGGEFDAVLRKTGSKQWAIVCGAHRPGVADSPLNIHLIQAMATGDRVEQALQKATELGVTRISVLQSARSQGRLSGRRLDKKQAHWQRVVVAAAEQSGRCSVPTVSVQADWLPAAERPRQRLLLLPDADQALHAVRPDRPIELAVGPEGGFSDAEIEQARAVGWTPVRCGPRVLRTETAGPAVMAALQALHGDWQ